MKSFDFSRPNKFSKEQLAGLETLHGNFAKMLSSFLSVYLRSGIKVRVRSVEQVAYEEFVSSLSGPTLITVFSLEPLKRKAVLETNMEYVYPTLDLMFGGTGKVNGEVRALSEIELAVMKKMHTKVLEIYSMAWSEIIEIKAELESVETNTRISQAITPKETVAVITFDTVVGTTCGLINICLPHIVLGPVIDRLSPRYWLTEGLGSPNLPEKNIIEKTLSKVMVDLTVVVGKTDLPVGEFLQVQEGDVLQLDKSVLDSMDLYVDSLLKFKARPGTLGNKRAVQILKDEGN
ncbi:MAG: flagellar motor switch protein FliM [Desulfitobacteriaceae bacterium]|nr:flagellar motor switch protein FliM [Desulfitobacteriaceae bacterium]